MPYCAQCGNEVDRKKQFCSNCGNPRKETASTSNLRKKSIVYIILPIVIIIVMVSGYYAIGGLRGGTSQIGSNSTQSDITAKDDSSHLEEVAEPDTQPIEEASIENLAENANEVHNVLEIPQTKIVIENWEGVDYEEEYTLYVSDLGYGIYYDDDRFQVVSQNGRNRIVGKGETWDSEYGEYIEIWLEESDQVELSDRIYSYIQNEFESHDIYPTYYSFGGITVSGFTFETFESDLYHIVDNRSGGSFVIRNKYCMETCASSMIYFMLDEFFIIQ